MYYYDVRRKVFISYYHGDQDVVNKFIADFSGVFIPKAVGVKDGDFVFDSNQSTVYYEENKRRKTTRFDSDYYINWKLYP